MYQPVSAIATRVVPYNDRNSIAHLYSRERGRLACLTPAGASREASRRRALLMPLNEVEMVVDIRPGRELHTMRDVRVVNPHHSILSDPTKSTVAIFIADFVAGVLREPQSDATLYQFLVDTARSLDGARRGVANLHICFLMRMMRFLGIEPDFGSWRRGWSLDMVEGCFLPGLPMHDHYLDAADSEVAWRLSRMTPDNAWAFRFNHEARNRIVDKLISYYALHDVNMGAMRSLDVLRSLY